MKAIGKLVNTVLVIAMVIVLIVTALVIVGFGTNAITVTHIPLVDTYVVHVDNYLGISDWFTIG